MEITQKEENGILTFTIIGRLDADSSPEAEKVVHDALEGQQRGYYSIWPRWNISAVPVSGFY